MLNEVLLSNEQQLFVDLALEGKNILVNACIGSGKTTAIQYLCNVLPVNKNILYLTYNRLLKKDAKKRINNKNVMVNNYHGFANYVLKRNSVSAGVSDLIQEFNKMQPDIAEFDVLMIDEYQDIDTELSEMLEIIKNKLPKIQIIAVGDMCQKIYNKTTLDVEAFIDKYLDDYTTVEFTQCFRLGKGYAEELGKVWEKKIIGVNSNFKTEAMDIDNVVDFLSNCNTNDIICLGARTQDMAYVLNKLENEYPDKFNKKTVYASIADFDSSVDPTEDAAIFTTFDSCKGMERKICVLFDFTNEYWNIRLDKPEQSYEILRNIFCVAASRGKEKLIIVYNQESILSFDTIKNAKYVGNKLIKEDISNLFDFKYKENVEKCYEMLEISKIPTEDCSIIQIPTTDAMIDLSPCIGKFQEYLFFKNENIQKEIDFHMMYNKDFKLGPVDNIKNESLEKQVLYLTFLDTRQMRYINQVSIPYVSETAKAQLIERLGTEFTGYEEVQKECQIDFEEGVRYSFFAYGICDVLKNNIVYELKFVNELRHEHFLQCACYMLALGLEKGVLWNTRNNEKYEIKIPNKTDFKIAVGNTVLNEKDIETKINRTIKQGNYIALIDTETNFNDEVISIGVIVADSINYSEIEHKYYIITPECKYPGMFSDVLGITKNNGIISRVQAIQNIKSLFAKYQIKKIFAYNAPFDLNHMSELSGFEWYDIMTIAANKNYNDKLPNYLEYCGTGKLKKGYGVEKMMGYLSNSSYNEKHNALCDAEDELKIMKLLNKPISIYIQNALVPKKRNGKVLDNENKKQYESTYVNNIEKQTYNVNSYTYTKPKETEVHNSYSYTKTKPKETEVHNSYSYTETKPKETEVHNSYSYTETKPKNTQNQQSNSSIDANKAANILNVSKSQVYKLIKTSQISAKKVSNKYIIDLDSVYEYKKREEKKKLALYLIIIGLILFFIIVFVIMRNR